MNHIVNPEFVTDYLCRERHAAFLEHQNSTNMHHITELNDALKHTQDEKCRLVWELQGLKTQLSNAEAARISIDQHRERERERYIHAQSQLLGELKSREILKDYVDAVWDMVKQTSGVVTNIINGSDLLKPKEEHGVVNISDLLGNDLGGNTFLDFGKAGSTDTLGYVQPDIPTVEGAPAVSTVKGKKRSARDTSQSPAPKGKKPCVRKRSESPSDAALISKIVV